MLGLEPKRSVRTFRAIGGAVAPLTRGRAETPRTDGAAYERELRHHFAHAPIPEPPKPPKPARGRRNALAAALRKAGARYEDAIVREASRYGLPVSLVCAVLEVETGFRNVFGHDDGPQPDQEPAARADGGHRRSATGSTCGFRRQGLGNQGVGPMQLTSPGLQDRADALGGCWKVDAEHPRRRRVPGGQHPAARPLPRRRRLQRLDRLRRQGAAAGEAVAREARRHGAARTTPAAGSGPRTLQCVTRACSGSDVLALQKLINQRFEEWKVGLRIDEDGDFGPDTRKAARRVAYGLGAGAAEYGAASRPRCARSCAVRAGARARIWHARGAGARGCASCAPPNSALAAHYPLGAHGPIIGTPYHGTHTRGNWQSDNAVDIRIPNGHAGDRARRRRDREDLQEPRPA